MLRPACPEAEALVADLQGVLARNLPVQLGLMAADGDPSLHGALAEALQAGLPEPVTWDEDALEHEVGAYLHGPRSQEAVAAALQAWVELRGDLLPRLEPLERGLIHQRVLAGHPWKRVLAQSDLDSVPAAQRALRRALRSLEALRSPSLSS